MPEAHLQLVNDIAEMIVFITSLILEYCFLNRDKQLYF